MAEHTKLAIIGGGPAGYSAAIYASRAMLQPMEFVGIKAGGQLMYTTEVENYAGFAKGIGGPDLMFEMRQQAEHFGTILKDQYVVAADFSARPFKLWTQLPESVDPQRFEKLHGEELNQVLNQVKQSPADVTADAVIVATGAASRMMGIPGEEEFLGKGVSTCAVCDAAFYRDKKVVVVGGGDSAMEDALALTKFASEIHIVHRRDSFKASKIMQDRVLSNNKIKVWWNTAPEAVLGQEKVTAVRLNQAGTVTELTVDGFFLAIGHIPMSAMFQGQLETDAHGFIVTRHSFSQQGLKLAQANTKEDGRVAFPSMTSVEGVFGAGDVVDLRYLQAITAAGQGAMAALDAERWLESNHSK